MRTRAVRHCLLRVAAVGALLTAGACVAPGPAPDGTPVKLHPARLSDDERLALVVALDSIAGQYTDWAPICVAIADLGAGRPRRVGDAKDPDAAFPRGIRGRRVVRHAECPPRYAGMADYPDRPDAAPKYANPHMLTVAHPVFAAPEGAVVVAYELQGPWSTWYQCDLRRVGLGWGGRCRITERTLD